MSVSWNELAIANHKAYQSRWPFSEVQEAVGVPLHDLRTLLAATTCGWHSPETAANVIQINA